MSNDVPDTDQKDSSIENGVSEAKPKEIARLLAPTTLSKQEIVQVLKVSLPKICQVTQTNVQYYSRGSNKIEILGNDRPGVEMAKKWLQKIFWPEDFDFYDLDKLVLDYKKKKNELEAIVKGHDCASGPDIQIPSTSINALSDKWSKKFNLAPSSASGESQPRYANDGSDNSKSVALRRSAADGVRTVSKRMKSRWAKPDKPPERQGFLLAEKDLPSQHPFSPPPNPAMIRIPLTSASEFQPHHVFISHLRSAHQFNTDNPKATACSLEEHPHDRSKYLYQLAQETNAHLFFDTHTGFLCVKALHDYDLGLCRDRIEVIEDHLTKIRMQKSIISIIPQYKLSMGFKILNNRQEVDVICKMHGLESGESLYRLEMLSYDDIGFSGKSTEYLPSHISDTLSEFSEALVYAKTLNFETTVVMKLGKINFYKVSERNLSLQVEAGSDTTIGSARSKCSTSFLDEVKGVRYVFDSRLKNSRYENTIAAISQAYPNVTPHMATLSSSPSGWFYYEIEAMIPQWIVNDAGELLILPQTRRNIVSGIKKSLGSSGIKSLRARKARVGNPDQELPDERIRYGPQYFANDDDTSFTGSGEAYNDLNVKIFIFPDRENSSSLSCQKVAVQNWDILNINYLNPSNGMETSSNVDYQLNVHSRKILKPKSCRQLKELVGKMLGGIKLNEQDLGLIFTNLDQKLKILNVKKREKCVWFLQNDIDVELYNVVHWKYPKYDHSRFMESQHNPINLSPKYTFNYQELNIVPSRLRNVLFENSNFCLGEVGDWNVPSVINDSEDSGPSGNILAKLQKEAEKLSEVLSQFYA